MSIDRVDSRPIHKPDLVEVRVALDDETASRSELDDFFAVVDKHDALAIGHDKGRRRGTSTLFFRSEGPVTKANMQGELGEVHVLSVKTSQGL